MKGSHKTRTVRRLVSLSALLMALPLILPDRLAITGGHKSLAKVKAFTLSSLGPQGKTIEIGLVNKGYVPPKRTAKIPQEFKEQGVSLAVRTGDILRMCNLDNLFYKPFSYSRYNKFDGLGGPRGLRPGLCTTYLVKNPTSKTITLALFDQIHGRQRILIAVLAADAADEGEEDTPTQEPDKELPSRCPGSFAGTWKTGFGTMTITFTSANEVVGIYDYDGGSIKARVSIDGQVLDGTYVENKGQGRFRFTLEPGGSRFKGNWNRMSGTREPPSGTWEGKCLSEQR